MKRSSWNPILGCTLAVVAAAWGGCTPSHNVPAGAPLLETFSVIDPGGAPVELTGDAAVGSVPPMCKFLATFDRLLDPTTLETIVPDGGGLKPNAGVASVKYSAGEIDNTTAYVPNGYSNMSFPSPYFFPLPGPSITVKPVMGMPSASMVTVTLDPTGQVIRSHDQTTPFKPIPGVSAVLMFLTDALTATIDVPPPEVPDGGDDAASSDDGGSDAGVDGGDDGGVDGADDAGVDGGGTGGPATALGPPVDPTFSTTVTFNNLTPAPMTGASTSDHIHVTATLAGAPIASLVAMVTPVAPDDGDLVGALVWTVAPPMDGWPAGAVVTITVDATAADNFGIKLGQPASASFAVKAAP